MILFFLVGVKKNAHSRSGEMDANCPRVRLCENTGNNIVT